MALPKPDHAPPREPQPGATFRDAVARICTRFPSSWAASGKRPLVLFLTISPGYATEAAVACRELAQEALGATELVAIIHPLNTASRPVAEKIGMTHVSDATSDHSPARIVMGIQFATPSGRLYRRREGGHVQGAPPPS
ncbi:GNAT family N-acetyltransferase [uncultured Cellulomonas sp.]|uniref:GNAT family N-acetyltransferase n=1 Tax=uncultured Cellulomonas sp. TaxID=189682 RepID=UPI0028E8FE8F|nr:GNAT family N-acetyltransferase [uncultured Cellulomonas sp.]